jgi:hypothetical protein
MPRDFEDDFNDDNACFECGEIDYARSKTPGICFDCWDFLHTHSMFNSEESSQEFFNVIDLD